MRLEPYEQDEGYRVWLSEQEENQLLNYYSQEPRKQLALELMFDGLRSEEVPRVSKDDFRSLDTDDEAYVLRIWKSKRGFRECPVSNETHKTAVMLANVRDITKDDPLIDVSERTVQRWVTTACDDLAQETGNDDWTHVSAHDLRRSWATRTYYSLDGDRSKEIVMSWGGWTDEQTFSENYIGRPSDSVMVDMMESANLR